MKKYSRILCIVLCISFLLPYTAFANSTYVKYTTSSQSNNNAMDKEEAIAAFSSSLFSEVAQIFSMDPDCVKDTSLQANFYLGDPFQIIIMDEIGNLSVESCLWYAPFYRNDTIIGIASVIKDGSVYHYSISKDFSEELNVALSKNSSVSIIAQNNDISILQNDKEYSVRGNNLSINAHEINLIPSTILNTSSDSYISISFSKISPMATTSSKNISVPVVYQGNLSICWAACVAECAQYRRKGSPSAKDVCDAIGHAYTEGTWNDVYNGFNIYGIGYTSRVTHAFSKDQIVSNINSGNPIYMGATAGTGVGAHHTILCGYNVSSSSNTYRFANSGTNSYQYTASTSQTAAGSRIQYSYNGHAYTWDSSFIVY